MYMKDLTKRVVVRLNEKQYAFLQKDSELLDVSISDYIRMVVNTSMCLAEKAKEQISNVNKQAISND